MQAHTGSKKTYIEFSSKAFMVCKAYETKNVGLCKEKTFFFGILNSNLYFLLCHALFLFAIQKAKLK